jgi:hypothetical protein
LWKGDLGELIRAFAPRIAGFTAGDARNDVLGKFYGQATKGVRWMPWRQKAKKDVASCDKPRGAASRL